ncbi:MAG: ATP-binding cassette protein [Chthonomonadales bacterium]|nr:ATP-binding cassette protein [Chthonomonadales bacterium]
MLVVFSPFAVILSPAPKFHEPRLMGRRLPLLLGLALGLCGCHARPANPATPLTSARSLTNPSSAVAQVQSSPLYRQARQDCAKHDYKHAAELLETLANTPGLAPEAVTFVQQQRTICLQDAGVATPTVPAITSPSVSTTTDADCGPRALLLLCQQLGVKTNLATLRKSAGTTAQGTTMAGLQQAAQRLGLKAEGVQVSRDALADITVPAIVHVHNHYVCLFALSGRGEGATAVLRDPNRSAKEEILQEQLLQRSGGYLLLVHR